MGTAGVSGSVYIPPTAVTHLNARWKVFR